MTINELKNLITKANEKKNAHYVDVPSNIVTAVTEINNEIVTEYCKGLANLTKADFINAFFNVQVAENLTSDKDIETAIKNSVSVRVLAVSVNDNGLIELDENKIKSIAFTDILRAKISSLAFCHSDNKPTKADRITANKYFFGDNGIGYLELFTHSAYKFMCIEDKTFKPNANYEKAFAEVAEICTKANKQNPFDKHSNSGYSEQIELLCEYFIGVEHTKLNAYHCKAIFQMICNRNRYGKFTIEDINTIYNSLAIVYRYAHNGYKLPINDKSTIYKVTK